MKPVVVNTPEPMVRVRVMTVKDYAEKTLKTLHRIGVLHVEESGELKPVDRSAIERDRKEAEELLACVDEVLSYIPEAGEASLAGDVTVIYTRPFSELDSEVRSLYTRLTELYQRTVEPNEEVKRLAELKGYLEPLAQRADLRLRDLNFCGTHLFSRVFVLPSEVYQTLRDKFEKYLLASTVIPVGSETIFYVIARTGNQKTVESAVMDAGGRVLSVPDDDLSLSEFLEVVSGRISSLEEKLTGLYQELRDKARENLERVVLLRGALLAESERLLVLEKACEARYVILIEGWIPEGNIEAAISEVKDSIDYVYIDTREPERSEEPPTKFRNSGWVKPFQVIVNLFGAPRYSEWDPTPIVAYSFAVFFALMAADVVYGIGLILATKFVLGKFVDDPESEGFKQFQGVLYVCGGIAAVLGLLSGSYMGDIYTFFGIESMALVPAIETALQDPVTFIVVALAIGVVHVNVAHVLAFIKGIKEKARGVVLNKIGLFLLQIFGIPYILQMIMGVSIPGFDYGIAMYILGASVVLVIVSAIVQSGGLGGVLWIFDLTGLLGDIMSYCRLAGVGLATFYLAQCFNLIAGLFGDMVPGAAGVIVGPIIIVLILIFGHILNLFLATLTGVIHSMRLCFVEFLIKFYQGGGKQYSPFRLKTKVALPVLAKS